MAFGSLIGAIPSVASGSALSSAALSLPLLSNPITAGLGILKGVGMLGGTKSESNSSAAYSGGGAFRSDNDFDFSYSKPFIDLENPVHIGVAGALLILAIYAYKKVK